MNCIISKNFVQIAPIYPKQLSRQKYTREQFIRDMNSKERISFSTLTDNHVMIYNCIQRFNFTERTRIFKKKNKALAKKEMT